MRKEKRFSAASPEWESRLRLQAFLLAAENPLMKASISCFGDRCTEKPELLSVTNWVVRRIFPDSQNFDVSNGPIGTLLPGNQGLYKAFAGRITEQNTAK